MAKLQMITEDEGISSRSSCPLRLHKNTYIITVDLSRNKKEQLRLTLSRDEIIRLHAWAGNKLGLR